MSPSLYDLVQTAPRPLLLRGGTLILDWSHKSACSHAVLWGFAIEGLIDACRKLHAFPHRYRQQVYYQSNTYLDNLRTLKDRPHSEITHLRICRDPEARLLSIFRHVIKTGFADAQIKAVLGIDVAEEGLSLRDFDDFLRALFSTYPPEKIDGHLRPQKSVLEDIPFGRKLRINIDTHNLSDCLQQVEEHLHLTVDRAALHEGIKWLETRHYNQPPEQLSELNEVENHRFKRKTANIFPKNAFKGSVLLGEMTDKFYGVDLSTTATTDSHSVLFATP